jgi:outer membrane protein W
MRALRTLLGMAVLVAAIPLSAQPIKIDVEGFYGLATSTGVDGHVAPQLDYRTIANYGGGVNLRWTTQFSTDLSVSSSRPVLRLGDFQFADFLFFGTTHTTPLSLSVQWHFLGLQTFDPYVGVGGAWVFASKADLYPFVLTGTNVTGVDFEDKLGFVANAGFRVNLFGPVGFLFDFKYIPLDLDATIALKNALPPVSTRFKADQFLLGLGASVRF